MAGGYAAALCLRSATRVLQIIHEEDLNPDRAAGDTVNDTPVIFMLSAVASQHWVVLRAHVCEYQHFEQLPVLGKLSSAEKHSVSVCVLPPCLPSKHNQQCCAASTLLHIDINTMHLHLKVPTESIQA